MARYVLNPAAWSLDQHQVGEQVFKRGEEYELSPSQLQQAQGEYTHFGRVYPILVTVEEAARYEQESTEPAPAEGETLAEEVNE